MQYFGQRRIQEVMNSITELSKCGDLENIVRINNY